MENFLSLKFLFILLYTTCFIVGWVFFEYRLGIVHHRHVQKIWPVGEDGLIRIHRRLKLFIRSIIGCFYLTSIIYAYFLL